MSYISDNYFYEADAWLLKQFERCNCIVFGPKGSGKDLLFAHVIYLRRQLHYANMPYNKNSILCTPKDLNVNGNTYKDLNNKTVKQFESFFISGLDIYISDAGIYLPSSEHKDLDKDYADLPIFCALSRHLGEHNVHVNMQSLGRVWIKLREQADCFIRVLCNVDYGDFIIVDTISYETYSSAEAGYLPNTNDEQEAMRGEIKYRSFYVEKKELIYDTHYFASVFYKDYEKPKKKVINYVI